MPSGRRSNQGARAGWLRAERDSGKDVCTDVQAQDLENAEASGNRPPDSAQSRNGVNSATLSVR
jgi:hypothetical protein